MFIHFVINSFGLKNLLSHFLNVNLGFPSNIKKIFHDFFLFKRKMLATDLHLTSCCFIYEMSTASDVTGPLLMSFTRSDLHDLFPDAKEFTIRKKIWDLIEDLVSALFKV